MSVLVVNSEKAIVRIHTGKLTEEERKEVLKRAAEKFFKDIQANNACRDCVGVAVKQ
jgi:ribosome recycling factor